MCSTTRRRLRQSHHCVHRSVNTALQPIFWPCLTLSCVLLCPDPMTAETSESNRQSYINAGFTSLLAKPYGLRDLQLMLRKHNPRPHEVSIARREQLPQQGAHQPQQQQQRQGPRGAVPAHQGHAAGRLQRRQLQEQRAMIARQRALERQHR